MTWTRHARVLASLLVAALLAPVAAAVSAICGLGAVPVARASSYGPLSFTPPAGPVGTQVTLQLNADVNTTTTFQLGATTTPPDQGQCADTVPLPGVGPVVVSAGKQSIIQFAWPAAFSSGNYWLCATEADGNGTLSFESATPYAVTSGPVASPTPAPPPAAVIQGPTSNLTPGATLTVDVSNWFTDDGTPPVQVRLLPDDGGTAYAQVVVVGNPTPGEYLVRFTLPDQLPPGHYSLQLAGGSLSQVPVSDITVVSSSQSPAGLAPSRVVVRSGQPLAPGDSAPSVPTPITLLVAALLALAVALLVRPALAARAARR